MQRVARRVATTRAHSAVRNVLGMRRCIRCCGVLALLLTASACDASPQGITPDVGQDYFPGEEWRSAQPRALGFDEARFDRMLRDARENRFGTLHGLIVIRNGYV